MNDPVYVSNDGRFPDGSPVLVRYPADDEPYPRLVGSLDARKTWPWLRGRIAGQRGPDDWHVIVEEPSLAELADGSRAPEGTPAEELRFPDCFRSSR